MPSSKCDSPMRPIDQRRRSPPIRVRAITTWISRVRLEPFRNGDGVMATDSNCRRAGEQIGETTGKNGRAAGPFHVKPLGTTLRRGDSVPIVGALCYDSRVACGSAEGLR